MLCLSTNCFIFSYNYFRASPESDCRARIWSFKSAIMSLSRFFSLVASCASSYACVRACLSEFSSSDTVYLSLLISASRSASSCYRPPYALDAFLRISVISSSSYLIRDLAVYNSFSSCFILSCASDRFFLVSASSLDNSDDYIPFWPARSFKRLISDWSSYTVWSR